MSHYRITTAYAVDGEQRPRTIVLGEVVARTALDALDRYIDSRDGRTIDGASIEWRYLGRKRIHACGVTLEATKL